MRTDPDSLAKWAQDGAVAPVDDVVVDLVGPDVRRFTNGMFTNNSRDLAVGGTQRSGMLDDRGRLQGLMTLHVLSEDRFRLVLEGVTAEWFETRYAKYILFDDVEIEPQTLAVSTVQGPRAEAMIADRGWQLGVDYVPHDRTGLGGIDVFHALEGPGEAIEALRIVAGIPRWPADMTAKQLPHEMGLRDTILHFEKGCYVGQEIVHRLDVLGGVRKRLVQLRFDGVVDVAPEQTVHAEGRKQGDLRSVLQVDGVETLALAVVRLPHDAPGSVVTVGEHTGVVRA